MVHHLMKKVDLLSAVYRLYENIDWTQSKVVMLQAVTPQVFLCFKYPYTGREYGFTWAQYCRSDAKKYPKFNPYLTGVTGKNKNKRIF